MVQNISNPNYPPNQNLIPIIGESIIPWPFEKALERPTIEHLENKTDVLNEIFEYLKFMGINIVFYKGSMVIPKTGIKTEGCSIDHVLTYLVGSPYSLPFILWTADSSLTTFTAVQSFMKYATDDRILGWNIMDEPKPYAWGDVLFNIDSADPSTRVDWDRLTLGYKVCRELLPDNLCLWTSAVPDAPRPDSIGTCSSYANYLATLQKLLKPAIWSYDVYPVIYNKINGVPELEIRHRHFYNSLRLFSNHVKNHGCAFWAYGMVASHASYPNAPTSADDDSWIWKYMVPTIGELRFELFSALAFGAQGLVYFRMSTGRRYNDPPWEETVSNEHYFDAPFKVDVTYDPSMSKYEQIEDATFDLKRNDGLIHSIRSVNTEILGFSSIFLGAELENAYQVYKGNTPYGDGIPVSTGWPGKLTVDIHWNNSSAPDSVGVVVTTLVKKDSSAKVTKRYIMIVSHDPLHPQVIQLRAASEAIRRTLVYKSRYFHSANPFVFTDSVKGDVPSDSQMTTPTPGFDVFQDGYYALKPGGYLILEQKL